ncbi:MAG TPA: hypothetical protein VGK13_04280 [Methanocellaceae archaeon]
MRINWEHLLPKDIEGLTDLDDEAEVKYPTGCVDMNKKELLAKISEIEFKLENTWTHEFLDLFEQQYRYMTAKELSKVLVDRLQLIYDWDEDVYKYLLD